jgi:hypothetical protein
MFVSRYTEQEAREAVASSLCYAEALRKLGLRPVGGNHRIFRKYVDQSGKSQRVTSIRSKLGFERRSASVPFHSPRYSSRIPLTAGRSSKRGYTDAA